MKKKKTEIEKRPVGRPTDYRPEYCDLLIAHMTEGLSFESFAGVIDATKQTIYSWTEKFPEFLDAKHRGTEKSRIFWERLAIEGRWNYTGDGSRNLNTRLWEINMQNRFRDEWKPKDAATVNVGVQVNNSNRDEVDAKVKQAREVIEASFAERRPLKIEGKS